MKRYSQPIFALVLLLSCTTPHLLFSMLSRSLKPDEMENVASIEQKIARLNQRLQNQQLEHQRLQQLLNSEHPAAAAAAVNPDFNLLARSMGLIERSVLELQQQISQLEKRKAARG